MNAIKSLSRRTQLLLPSTSRKTADRLVTRLRLVRETSVAWAHQRACFRVLVPGVVPGVVELHPQIMNDINHTRRLPWPPIKPGEGLGPGGRGLGKKGAISRGMEDGVKAADQLSLPQTIAVLERDYFRVPLSSLAALSRPLLQRQGLFAN